jgi:hypothetical protein
MMSGPATVAIEVCNNAPVVYQAVVHTYRNRLVSGQLDGYDPDGDPIYAFLNSESGMGSVYLGLDGTFSYIPPQGFVGAETFSYYWSDGISASEIASVTIEISNRAPVAVDMSIETVEDAPVMFSLSMAEPALGSEYAWAAYDPDGDLLSYTIITGPRHGELVDLGGLLVYTPAAGYTGEDEFYYQVSDGIATSAVAQVQVQVKPNQQPPPQNLVLDLTGYRPYNRFMPPNAARQEQQVPAVPANQEDNPGVGIRFNGDDDDNDGMADYRDNNGVAGEDDLVRIDLQFGVQQPPAGIDYYLKRSAGVLQVWTGPAKPGNGLFGNNVNEVKINFGQGGTATLWVEWIGDQQQPVNAVLTFEARNANGQVVGQSDSLTFYRFQTTVIVIGGFRQLPTLDARQGARRGHRIFRLARRLYEEGYDVHVFGENDQVSEIGPNTGRGRAYDTARFAVDRHHVDNIVAMGFSWGGGAVFNLTQRLDNARNGLIGNERIARPFRIPFTAYIDAIQHGQAGFNPPPETCYPIISSHHVNYYQQIDTTYGRFGGIRGAPVEGAATNVDVNDGDNNHAANIFPRGLSLDHGNIDDSDYVLGLHEECAIFRWGIYPNFVASVQVR